MYYHSFILLVLIGSEILPRCDCFILPSKCNVNVTFWLNSRKYRDDPPYELIPSAPETIKKAKFVPKTAVKILIHGFGDTKDDEPNLSLIPAYFENEHYNIISVDYRDISTNHDYDYVINNLPQIARCTTQLIDLLVKQWKISLQYFHIIGYGVGAHIGGAAASLTKTGKIERVTGLDPAILQFIASDSTKRLSQSDAEFVDVIHTNALGLGKLDGIGHADFYVNGGLRQIGCQQKNNMTVNKCSSLRSVQYFAESINSESGFYGRKCSSWFTYMLNKCGQPYSIEAVMGDQASKNCHGRFFVNTKHKPPFAKGPSSPKYNHNKYWYDLNENVLDDHYIMLKLEETAVD